LTLTVFPARSADRTISSRPGLTLVAASKLDVEDRGRHELAEVAGRCRPSE
jgi:hypothetical protein